MKKIGTKCQPIALNGAIDFSQGLSEAEPLCIWFIEKRALKGRQNHSSNTNRSLY